MYCSYQGKQQVTKERVVKVIQCGGCYLATQKERERITQIVETCEPLLETIGADERDLLAFNYAIRMFRATLLQQIKEETK